MATNNFKMEDGNLILEVTEVNLAVNDLTDINAPTPNINDVLSWSGTEWISAPQTGGGSITLGDDITYGDGTASSDKEIISNIGKGNTNPKLRYKIINSATLAGQWEFSNDGIVYYPIIDTPTLINSHSNTLHTNYTQLNKIGEDGTGNPTWNGNVWPNTGVSGPIEWVDIQNKPTSFTPTIHTHNLADIADLSTLTLDWSKLLNIPTSFNPTSHTHPVSDITGTLPGGQITYTNNTAVPTTVGGIQSGSTFDNKTIQEMLDMLLYPYQLPTFSSFSLTGFSSALEVGDSIPTNKVFTWATTNNSNIQPNSIRIIDVTNSNNPIASNLANDGTETISTAPITKNVASSHTFRIEGTNTNSVTFNRTININWQFKIYSGESTDTVLDESKIKLLRLSNITSSSGIAKTYNFNTGGYKYIVYPASYGTLSEFKDQSTNLDIPMQDSYLVSVTNTFGIETNYRVHRTTNIINGSIDIIAG